VTISFRKRSFPIVPPGNIGYQARKNPGTRDSYDSGDGNWRSALHIRSSQLMARANPESFTA